MSSFILRTRSLFSAETVARIRDIVKFLSGRNVTVQAESPSEARQTVMDRFPGAVVTSVSRVK